MEQKLEELGIELPDTSTPPVASYIPYTISGNQVFISGQLPMKDGALIHEGLVGRDINLEQAGEAARLCAINILAQLRQACGGDLSKVKKILKLEILVACTSDFTQQHIVANSASDLMVHLFEEEIGSHARAAYGVESLPLNAPVEITAIVEIG